MTWKALLVVMAAAMSIAASLPDKGPAPLPKPVETPAMPDPPAEAEAPVPEARPNPTLRPSGKPGQSEADDAGSAGAAEDGKDDGTDDTPASSEAEKTAEPAAPPLTIEAENEGDLKACMADLAAIGTGFTRIDRVDDGDGCGMDKPIHVERVLPGVALSPAGDMRCQTALQLARWVKHAVLPAAEAGLPAKATLTSVNHASTYVCRKRNGASEGKISEHARGTAIDIASLSFGQETVAMRIVKPEDSALEDAFQRAINATACLYFTTVLSPGSDATHQDHMHLDMLKRDGGFRYCR